MSTSNATIGTGSETPSGKPTDEQAFLQVMYKEYCDRLRQNETLRQQGIAVVFALSGALTGVEGALLVFASKSTTENGLQGAAAPLLFVLATIIGLFVMLLGISGCLFAIKLSERVDLHEYYSRMYRNELQKMFDQKKYQCLRRKANEDHGSKWPCKQLANSHVYWIGINYVVIALGFVMAIIPWLCRP